MPNSPTEKSGKVQLNLNVPVAMKARQIFLIKAMDIVCTTVPNAAANPKSLKAEE